MKDFCGNIPFKVVNTIIYFELYYIYAFICFLTILIGKMKISQPFTYKFRNDDIKLLKVNVVSIVVENMLFIIIRSYRTSRQIDLNFDSLSMGI